MVSVVFGHTTMKSQSRWLRQPERGSQQGTCCIGDKPRVQVARCPVRQKVTDMFPRLDGLQHPPCLVLFPLLLLDTALLCQHVMPLLVILIVFATCLGQPSDASSFCDDINKTLWPLVSYTSKSDSQWMKEKARRGDQEQEGAAPKQAKTRNASSKAPRQEESRVPAALIILYKYYPFRTAICLQ